jgi:hypothetical protein
MLLSELMTDEVNFGSTIEIRVRLNVVSHGDRDI